MLIRGPLYTAYLSASPGLNSVFDHIAPVMSHRLDFESLEATVVTISFGTPYWARIWLEETRSSFHLILDRERAVYRA